MKRPDCIRHWRELEGVDDATYPDSTELFSIGAPLARGLRLNRLGIHHERLPPGRRTSYPHAESDEEEFIYVLEGYPEVWINGYLWKLEPGDSVGFPAGTGVCHTFINNTSEEVRLLVVGEANKKTQPHLLPAERLVRRDARGSLGRAPAAVFRRSRWKTWAKLAIFFYKRLGRLLITTGPLRISVKGTDHFLSRYSQQ